jgi:hypothetical protein
LATQRGWSSVIAVVDDLLSSHEETIGMACPTNVDGRALQRWIAQQIAHRPVNFLPLEELAHDPLPAVKVQKLIAVFACGTLLGTSEVDAMGQAFFSRPLGSYTIVLTGAEELSSEEDLNLIERGMWRLLVPDQASSGWREQDLSAYGCYLWSNGEARDFLRTRLEQDQRGLLAWLKQPLPCTEEVERMQVLYTLELAEDHVNKSRGSATGENHHFAQRLGRAQETLTTQRRRLLRRLDDHMESLERQLTTSLQSLEQDLLQGLRPYLQHHFVPSSSGNNEAVLKTVLTQYMSRGARSWEANAQQILLSRSEEITAEIESLLSDLDWPLINEVASRQGLRQTYPDALLRNLHGVSLGNFSADIPRGGSVTPDTQGNSPRMRGTLAGILTGSGILTAITLLLGIGPIQLVAGGAAAVLSGVLTKEKLERGQLLSLAETQGHSTITAVLSEAISKLQEHIQQIQLTLRRSLSEGLRTLEIALNKAYQEAQQPATPSQVPDTDLQLLASYRRSIVAIGDNHHH